MCKGEIILEVEELRASYHKKDILNGITLEVREKETVGLIGPNGSGKSTLLKSVFGLLQSKGGHMEGKILFKGRDLTSSPPSEKVGLGLAYLMQGGPVFSNLTVEDNLSVVAGRQDKDIEARKGRIYSLFPALEELKRRRAGLLSGGGRQMLAIGMTLMNRPQLLLLDEPTAGLGPKAIEDISAAISVIKRELGLSILLIEQNVEKCLALSDRIYLMRNGRIIDVDVPENIVRFGKLDRLFFPDLSAES